MIREASKGCPFHEAKKMELAEFREKVTEYRQQIVQNMNDLGLDSARLSSQVNAAAITGARHEIAAFEAAITPFTYTEVSREGNEKPVTHPIHSLATALASAYAKQLQLIGIYASADKVKTKAKTEDDEQTGALSFLSPDDDDD